MVKVGLIGYGMAGQVFHAPMLMASGLDLAKIQTNNAASRSLARERYPNAALVDNENIILEDAAIQLVVIATPNVFHFPLAKKALEIGKNVVVDKPFTITSQQADELIALAESKKLVLSVFQNRRWDSDFLTISKLLKNNTLGDIVEFESHYDRYRPQPKQHAWREEPKPGSGVLYDLGAHLIDQALQLFGLPQALYADIRTQRPTAQVDDYFSLKLYYEKSIVTLGAGSLVAQPRPRFILNGNKGSYVKYGLDIQEDTLKKGIFPSEGAPWGKEPENNWGTLVWDQNGSLVSEILPSEKGDYRCFYRNIKDAIEGRAPLQVLPRSSRDVIKVIEWAIESNRLRKVLDFAL